MHPKAKQYPNGSVFRSRELRPLAGEARRWVVIREGRPYCIKRTLAPVVECAVYRGVALTTHEPVFVWSAWKPTA